MRLDKFLKLSRVIKRRVLAKEAIEKNHVFINDKLAKPYTEVKEGDIVEIKMTQWQLRFQINHLLAPNAKRMNDPMISVLSEHHHDEDA